MRFIVNIFLKKSNTNLVFRFEISSFLAKKCDLTVLARKNDSLSRILGKAISFLIGLNNIFGTDLTALFLSLIGTEILLTYDLKLWQLTKRLQCKTGLIL